MIAVQRLRGDLRQSSLRLRWFAWQVDGGAPVKETGGTLSRLEPDVIRVKPGTVISFTPIFSGGGPQPCDFHVADKRDGVITRDGIYTAPDHEGLYQVYAQVRGKPEERSDAFIIVEMEGGHEQGDI